MKIEEIFARRDDFIDENSYGNSIKWKILHRNVTLGGRLHENPSVPVDFQAKLSLFGGGSN